METGHRHRSIEDPRLLAAIAIALVFHGGLLVAGTFRRTYDAYVHIFFADHYARDWFSTWETRWYTGFTTTSYPPGTHQLIALLSRMLGLEWAFVVVQLVAVLLLVIGVYRFARLWVGDRAAGWAALLAALSSSVAETVHTFGQLPTTFSLGMLLNATPFVHRWVVEGRRKDLAYAVAITCATTAAHHVTTLFGSVFFLGPVIVAALMTSFRAPRSDEVPGHPLRFDRVTAPPLIARRLRRVLPAAVRTAAFGGLVIAALGFVVLPYWLWTSSDPITQIPIPHASRANYLEERNAGLVFWLVPWGMLLVAWPFAVMRGLASRAWPLAASVILLTLLGTGGTTPLPRMLLGGAYEILTLDRFTFWATIAVLPLAGWFVESLVNGRAARLLRTDFGRHTPRVVQVVLAVALLASAVLAANLASARRFQPDPIDPAPISAFLDKDQHSRWRYLTLGFGDQMAWIAANTTATTVDGNYHSARRLPELITTPVERLEGAKFRGVPGIGSLQQFLAVPAKYNLKFVFSNDEFYDPLLWASGWHRLERLANGIVVWEREDIPPLPTALPTREAPLWQRAMWGTVPMASFAAAFVAFGAAARSSATGWSSQAMATATTVWRPFRRLDRRLGAISCRLTEGSRPPRGWHGWQRARAALNRWLDPQRGRRGRSLLVAVAALTVLLIAGIQVFSRTASGPEDQVVAYYVDLDFRDHEQAYDRLDPETRPSLDHYLLERSVEDGLVVSYGKLERIDTELVALEADRAIVRVGLGYVTALMAYEEQIEHHLIRHRGRWYLEPPQSDPTIPADQFVRRTGIDFLSQGRRQVTTGTTAYADVIDRPEVVTTTARLVRARGRWVVVGEIFNQDVDPADVTITAQLLDAKGTVLASYDAAQITVHKVLPKEQVPFRVEFEGIAGALDVTDPAAGIFDPRAVTSLQIDDDAVASFAVYAKAVVTGRDLDRTLVAQEVGVEVDESGAWLTGQVRNDGTTSVTVPHLVMSYRGDDGALIWVDHVYLDGAVRPQRSTAFRVRLADMTEVVATNLPGTTYDNGLDSEGDRVGRPALLTVEAGLGFSTLDLEITGFARDAS